MAGGNYVEVFNAGAYKTTKYAKQGDLGTKVLKPRPTGTVWKRGSVQHPRWELTAAHGGGYQYRLCPAGSTLDETCFSKNPVAFARAADGGYKHTAIFANASKNHEFNATMVESGGGVGWMLHPHGYSSGAPCDWNPGATGLHCKWGCAKCGAPCTSGPKRFPCSCPLWPYPPPHTHTHHRRLRHHRTGTHARMGTHGHARARTGTRTHTHARARVMSSNDTVLAYHYETITSQWHGGVKGGRTHVYDVLEHE